MAIPEELKTAVFAYCREVEDEETLPAMTVAWDAAVGYLEGAGVTRPPRRAPATASGWGWCCPLPWMPMTRGRPRPRGRTSSRTTRCCGGN